jgi:hypothetical protein
MKTRHVAVALALLLFSSAAFGQDYVFKVLANKGLNEVKVGDSWQPLKTGASLKENDEIKLVPNAYLGLVHVKGKPLEVKDPGSHKISDLAKLVSAGTTVLHKYTDFILSSNSAEAQKNKLSATGAVDRGETMPIQLMLPENQFSGIFNNKAVITWRSSGVQPPYVITFKNMFDDELFKVETSEEEYVVDLTDPRFTKENAILLVVKSKQDSKLVSKEHLIKKLSNAEKETIRKDFSQIENGITEQTALNKFILAGFYEEHKLYIDAIAAYEDAIKLAPDVAEYKEAFEDFLVRNAIKKTP